MKVLHYALVLAVVLGATMATAQETDKPLPWWKLADNTPAKDQPQAEDDAKKTKKVPAQPGKETIKERLEQARTSGRKTSTLVENRLRQPSKPAPRERLVYRLSNAPAGDVVQTVNDLLRSERAVPGPPKPDTIVLADVVSNSIIISGTSDAIHQTVKLVEQLDAEPLMVCVQAVIGLVESREGLSLLAPNAEGPELSCSHEEACELIEEFSKSDAVKILARPQIMTLDNQPAFLQIGHRVPRPASMKDGKVTTVELENVGLILALTPRISSDHMVTMEIDLEKSDLSSEDEGIPLGVDSEGNVVRCPKMDVMSVQTTVKIPPGRAVIIGGLALQDGDDRGELVLVVTPHIVKQEK
jgi:type II secretory pathway component GspD/PulD (secretin)